MPKHEETHWGAFRNALAHGIANFALTYIATPWYRDMIGGLVRLGMATVEKEENHG